MQEITEDERNELLKQIDEQDDEDEMIRKISSLKPKFKLGEAEEHIKSDWLNEYFHLVSVE